MPRPRAPPAGGWPGGPPAPRAARPKAGLGCAESGRLKKFLEGVQ